MNSSENITNISIDLLIPNAYQPRKSFSEQSLNELAQSIKEYGILNPILVRKKDDKYEIIAGERRFRAAKIVGLTEVPVIIKTMEDAKAAEVALIENLQRENITPIEEAKSYEEIIKLSNITQQRLSEMIGKSQSYVANKIRLLSLPENIQEALINKKISERHARSLMTVEDAAKQTELLERIIKEKLTVKDLDNIINEKKITEEEIQSAINDIIKSLSFIEEEDKNDNHSKKDESIKDTESNNIKEEKETQKEEKESDKMDNGNFFPNFNNTMGTNNNVSLNSMNMQTMNQNMGPMAPVEETVMPTINQAPAMDSYIMPSTVNPIPNFGINQQPVMSQPEIQVPMMNTEQIIPESVVTEPVVQVMPEVTQMENPVMTTPEQITPTSIPEMSPMAQTEIMPEQPVQTPMVNMEPAAPMIDTPLFAGQVDTPLFGGQMDAPVASPQPVIPTPQIETPMESVSEPINFIQDIPLFSEQNLMPEPIVEEPVNQVELPENNPVIEPTTMMNSETVMPEVTPMETPVMTTPEQIVPSPMPETSRIETPQMIDTPIFGGQVDTPVIETPVVMPQPETNINESFYEVPVNISPVIEDTNEENKLTQVQELLSRNGIEYKTYSNETGHCIIIEL